MSWSRTLCTPRKVCLCLRFKSRYSHESLPCHALTRRVQPLAFVYAPMSHGRPRPHPRSTRALCSISALPFSPLLPNQALVGDGFSPPRPPPHPQNAGTPSTLSTSPGESRDWNNARHSSNKGPGDEYSNLKRARTEGTVEPPPPPPPPRFRLPQVEEDRQMQQGAAAGSGAVAAKGGGQSHARRRSRGSDGGGSPTHAQAPGRLGGRRL